MHYAREVGLHVLVIGKIMAFNTARNGLAFIENLKIERRQIHYNLPYLFDNKILFHMV